MKPLRRLLLVSAVLAACTPAPRPQPTTSSTSKAPPPPANTKIVSFSVGNDNLNVDKVGMRDGFFKPDGNRDLVFNGVVDGPFEAVFIVSVSAKGDPAYGLRADTLTGNQELPPEIGTVVDTGKMTFGIGVVEDGKFINGDSGSTIVGEGVHKLIFYVPNSATLKPGDHVRLFVRAPGGALVAGPITPY